MTTLKDWTQCPFCGEKTDIHGTIREYGESRLSCGQCGGEWNAPICPYCGEQKETYVNINDGDMEFHCDSCGQTGRKE